MVNRPRSRSRSRYRRKEDPLEEDHIADRFSEVDEETRKWLDRMNTDERVNHVWIGRKSEAFRQRADQLMGLPEDRWIAIFSVSLTYANILWALKTSFWIITGVAGTLVAYNNIFPYIKGLVGG